MWFKAIGGIIFLACLGGQVRGETPVDLGSRRELLVDDFVITKREGVDLKLHQPMPREIVFVYDRPWEGNGCTYRTIFRDGDLIRMWYTGGNFFNEDGTKVGGHPIFYCYAESKDGIHWVRPDLGLYEFEGSKKNNIVWTAPDADNFMVFKDSNPNCRSEEKYKAVAQGRLNGVNGLRAFKSPDGIHWSELKEGHIITKGAFDSLNVVFWEPIRKKYFCYLRDFKNDSSGHPRRIVCVATSDDFLSWSEPEPLTYVKSPEEELYTNNVQPYFRSPELFLGFPTRYLDRGQSAGFLDLPDPEHRQNRMKIEPRFGTVLTDGQFMTSRDGQKFNRWSEPFFRPGIQRLHNWNYGDCYVDCGLLETPAEDPTAPNELSFYVEENHGKTKAERTRRYTLRMDGFVSASASAAGGELITKPILFAGEALSLNFTTSVAGSLRVELQDANGKPIPGFTLEDSVEMFGDQLDRLVTWKSGKKLDQLAGNPIKVRFVMKDSDLYSMQFK